MKRNFILLILFFLICSAYSQTISETISFRFIYDVQAKKYMKSKTLSSDEHWLDIGENGVSKYYSIWKEKAFNIKDSINRIGGSSEDSNKARYELSTEHSNFPYYVFKNYPHAGKQTVNYISMEHFQYQESMGQEWDLVEGDTIILDHPCQKAVCKYHGKVWYAYYTTDIPIFDGPWKLCGLPGLIMKAYDDTGGVCFNCVGIQLQVEGELMMRDNKSIKLKPEQAHKLIMQIDNDPDGYLATKGHFGKAKVIDQHGREMTVNFSFPQPFYYEYYSTEKDK